ncbi:MAG TPA: MFS transporter [Ktedonobacterales bacterium]|nr:MFS transporter [Ktedonobacterales bacterium]
MTTDRRSILGAWRARYPVAFRALWAARTLSVGGDYIAQVALVLLAARQHNPVLAVSALFLAQTVPWLLSPLAGALAERVAPRWFMVGSELGQLVVVGVLAIVAPPFPVTLALVAAMTLLAVLFLPASQSVLPGVVSADALNEANALLRLGLNVSRALGPLVGAALLIASGVRGALLADAASFLLSAALLSALPAISPNARAATPTSDEPSENLWVSMRAGVAYITRTAIARAVVIGLFLVTLFVALDNIGLIFLAQRTFGSATTGFGALLAGYGAGMIAAPLILLPLGRRLTTLRSLLVGVALMGVGTAVCGLAPTLWLAVAAQALVGVGNGFQNVANDSLLQQTTPRPLLGRVFGIAYSAPYAALLITYALGGALLNATSPRVVFVIAGLGTLAMTGVIAWQAHTKATKSSTAAAPSRSGTAA